MRYDFIAIPDQDVPQARDLLFQHLVVTYASETNKTASMWSAIPYDLLDYKPHEKVNTIRAILIHQILSERRFFAQFAYYAIGRSRQLDQTQTAEKIRPLRLPIQRRPKIFPTIGCSVAV
jgi:hypothetical protein